MADTIELDVEARQVREGDVFILHGHERTANAPAWPVRPRGHVHIRFVGGGDAVILATRPLTVTRTAP